MKKIVLATAALLAVSSAAFAGSDNYGSNNAQPSAVSVDTTRTSSIRERDSAVYKLLNSSGDAQKSAPQGANRDLFGR